MSKFPYDTQKRTLAIESIIIVILGICVYVVSAHYDILEEIVRFSHLHENWEVDEFLTVSLFIVLALAVFSVRRWQELRISKKNLLQLNEALRKSLSEINQLRGILPICANCKKIRDDEGYWSQIEAYVHAHADVEFSHSICPDCMKKLYSDYIHEEKEEDEHS